MILNPFILFSSIWLFVLFLYSLELSYILTPLNSATVMLVGTSCTAFLLGWGFVCMAGRRLYLRPEIDRDLYARCFTSDKIKRRVVIIGWIWGGASLFEILFFKGMPFLSLFGIGAELSYIEFGIPGVHGVLNALYLVLVAYVFFRQLFIKSKAGRGLLFLLLLWPVLLMTRQLMTSVIVQLVLLYIAFKPPKLKNYLVLFLVGSSAMLLFGYLGDLRSGRDAFLALAAPSFDYPENLPSAFMWIYIYMTSPLNNINFNIANIKPYFFPVNVLLGFFPSLVRDSVSNMFNVTDEIELVNPFLNVSSFYNKLLQDFGLEMTPVVLFFVAVLSCYLMARARKNPGNLFALIIILHGLLFSVFVDFLFHLVFVTQILVFLYLFRNIKSLEIANND